MRIYFTFYKHGNRTMEMELASWASALELLAGVSPYAIVSVNARSERVVMIGVFQ